MLPNPEARHWIPAVVEARHNSPRSYLARSPNNVYRRNRLHLRRVPHSANVGPVESQPPSRFYSSQDMRDFPDPTAQQDTPVENCCKSPQVQVSKNLNLKVSQQCHRLEPLHLPEIPSSSLGAAELSTLPDVWIFKFKSIDPMH